MTRSDMQRPALLCIDLNQLCSDPDGAYLRWLAGQGVDLEYFTERLGETVIPNVNALAEVVRDVGGQVVWVRPEFRSDGALDWPPSYREQLCERGFGTACCEGMRSFELDARLDVKDEDHQLYKFGTSVFWGGSAGQLLRSIGTTHVLFAGCLTNRGVVINAIDSSHNGFVTTIVEDCCVAKTAEAHDRSLRAQAPFYLTAAASEVMERLTVLVDLVAGTGGPSSRSDADQPF